MTVDLATLPHPDTLPIPDDVSVNGHWSPLMIEIADHIGARATLELCQRFGGQRLRIPYDPARNPFVEAVGEAAAVTISRIFGGEHLDLPLGRQALRHARRQTILAQVRAGGVTLSEAARLLRINRRHISVLINQTDEGKGVALPPAERRRRGDCRQIDLFAD